MNIADRSLALVDLALRRRFAFVGLEPRLGPAWRNWVVSACGVDEALASDIERRMAELNEQIAADARLGKQFRIGHSFASRPCIGWMRAAPGDGSSKSWTRNRPPAGRVLV